MLAQALLDEMSQSLKLARHRIKIVLINKAPATTTFTKDMVEGMLQHDLAGVITPSPDLAFQAAEWGGDGDGPADQPGCPAIPVSCGASG